MYKYFLALRYLLARRIAYFSIAAMMLSVWMVIVVHSVMTGFLDDVQTNCQRLSGEIVIEAEGLTSFPLYDEFIAHAIEALGADLIAATPVVSGHGLLKILGGYEDDSTDVVQVIGVRYPEYRRVTGIDSGLFYDLHYPGTTHLRKSRMPVWYWTSQGVPQLPADHIAAINRRCEGVDESHEDSQLIDECDAMRGNPQTGYSGPGRFRPAAMEPPRGHSVNPPERGFEGGPRPSAIVGYELVVHHDADFVLRKHPRGAEMNLTLLVPSRRGGASGRTGRTVTMRYIDDSHTRVYAVDSATVYCDFDWLQDMLDLGPMSRLDGGVAPGRAVQIQVKLADGVDVEGARQRLNRLWSAFVADAGSELDARDQLAMTERVRVKTWEQKYTHIIAPVRNERVLAMVLFGVVSAVAIVVVGCVFYLIVAERTREIGIVRSVGATARGVGAIFVLYALGIGLVGSTLGSLCGAVFVYYINDLQDWLISMSPSLQVWSPSVYGFDRIPNQVHALDVVCIAAVSIGASVIGSLVAARRAARIWPVSALRFE
jgi:lipoprotein-releasing system permease protein